MATHKVHTATSFISWLQRQVLFEKMNNPFGYALLLMGGLAVALALSLLPVKLAGLAVAGLIVVPIVVACFFDLFFGLLVMIASGFLLGLASKFTAAPLGTALDGLLVLMLGGMFARIFKERDFSFFKSPISLLIFAWIYYNVLQVLNVEAASRIAWVYTVRTVALLLALYFIACYVLNSYRRVLITVKAILILGGLSALYAFKQEFLGFSGTEISWLHADEERFKLIFQWDRLRVFSFFSDPTTFGILMGYLCVFSLVLATGPFKIWKKAALIIMGICMLIAMAFAGSRTPFVLLPIGLVFYLILNFKKETILVCLLFFMAGAAFVMKSTTSAVIWRIQSAFRGESSDTIEVRLMNQRKVRPFIQSHPFGAGLGSTGYWGKRFSPNSWLSGFAHDSLYVRLAVETGWIGLLLYMSLLFIALKTGIYYYFRVKDPTIKVLYLGFTMIVFLLSVASYPQEAITLLPNSIVFYVVLAMIVRLKDFDENFQKKPAAVS